MKIDKTNPAHWLCLFLFGLNVLAAMALRPFFHRRGQPRRVILYGHKLSGNLLALRRYIQGHAADEFTLTFLTMDKRYARQLLLDGVHVAIATRPEAIALMVRADAVISDHGLHVMQWLVGRSDIRFFDVWHGFGFKGHAYGDFRVLRHYDEAWVDSPLQAGFYRDRFGFDPAKVHATGYARIDRLVRRDEDVAAIRRSLKLDAAGIGKLVLFAPTWKQEVATRSMYPFGLEADAFVTALSTVAQRTGSTILMRSHLNTGMAAVGSFQRVMWLPATDYPDTEALLLASDVLVADWSSIVFDWLLLARPTVFLDVPPPFTHGHTLDGSYRYGEIVGSLDQLCRTLEHYLTDPAAYQTAHRDEAARIREAVFGSCADGRAAARCTQRLRRALQ